MKKTQKNIIEKALNSVLRKNANSTACFIHGQPKAPKTLTKFKKNAR